MLNADSPFPLPSIFDNRLPIRQIIAVPLLVLGCDLWNVMLPLSDLMSGVPPQNPFQKGETRTRAIRLSLDLGARLKHKLDDV